jgi:hypothetical protein
MFLINFTMFLRADRRTAKKQPGIGHFHDEKSRASHGHLSSCEKIH